MVSRPIRNEAWYEFGNSARLVLYFEAMAAQYRSNHNRFSQVILVGSIASALVALLLAFLNLVNSPVLSHTNETVQEAARIVASVTVGVAAIWSRCCNDVQKAMVLRTVWVKCSHLSDEYKDLWLEIQTHRISDELALRKLKELSTEIKKATEIIGLSDIPENEKINREVTVAADTLFVQQYGGIYPRT